MSRINRVLSLSLLESLGKLVDVNDERDDVADEFSFNKSLPPAGTLRDLKKRSISVFLFFSWPRNRKIVCVTSRLIQALTIYFDRSHISVPVVNTTFFIFVNLSLAFHI